MSSFQGRRRLADFFIIQKVESSSYRTVCSCQKWGCFQIFFT